MIHSPSLIDLRNQQLVSAFRQNQVMVNNLLQKQIHSSRSNSFQMIKPLQPTNTLVKQPTSNSVQPLWDPNYFVTKSATNLSNLNSIPPTGRIPIENARTVQSLRAINSSLDRELLSRQVSFTKYLISHQNELARLLSRQSGDSIRPHQPRRARRESELLNFVQSYHSKRLHNLRKRMETTKKDHTRKSTSSYFLVDENVKLNKKKERSKVKDSNGRSSKDKKSTGKKLTEIDLDKVTIKINKLNKSKVSSFVALLMILIKVLNIRLELVDRRKVF